MNRLLIPVYVFSLIRRDRFSRVKDPRIILDQSSALFLLAEVSPRDPPRLRLIFSRQIFLVFRYQPMIEELADIILSADIDTVEAVQRRYGEQVLLFLSISVHTFSPLRLRTVPRPRRSMCVSQRPIRTAVRIIPVRQVILAGRLTIDSPFSSLIQCQRSHR